MCQHTTPRKDKYVAIVCANPNPYGFFINSKISKFAQSNPDLLNAQVKILVDKYGFLGHDSYINCGELYPFKAGDLHSVQKIQNNTRAEIKRAVSESRLIAPIHKKLILGESSQVERYKENEPRKEGSLFNNLHWGADSLEYRLINRASYKAVYRLALYRGGLHYAIPGSFLCRESYVLIIGFDIFRVSFFARVRHWFFIHTSIIRYITRNVKLFLKSAENPLTIHYA